MHSLLSENSVPSGNHALHTENEFSVKFVDLGSQNGLGSKGKQITGACKQTNVNKKRDDVLYFNFCKLISNMIVLTE